METTNLPKTQKEAKALGLSKFFTGEPCKYGHVAARYTKSYSCCECHTMHTANHRTKPEAKKVARKSYEQRRSREPERIMYYSAKGRARKFDVPFDITTEDILAVWPENGLCPVLGIPLIHNFDKESGCCAKASPTLDRITPEKGYVRGNIVVISLHANQLKNSETNWRTFLRVASWMYKISKKGN